MVGVLGSENDWSGAEGLFELITCREDRPDCLGKGMTSFRSFQFFGGTVLWKFVALERDEVC